MGMLNSIHREVYREVIKLLRDNPEHWKFGTHEATFGNITIWVVNRYYATRFNVGSIHVGTNNPLWWVFPWEWWRVELIKEVERAQLNMARAERK